MGLKARFPLLMALLILNSDITIAVTQDDPFVAKTPDVGRHFLRKQSSWKPASPPSSASSSSLVLIGSSAPDCLHTCGACFPCTVQIVSFECNQAAAAKLHAEACPLGYLCVCHGRAFPRPLRN